MIEEGIIKLVQSDPTVMQIVVLGGHLAELPKNPQLPNWTLLGTGGKRPYALQGENSLTLWRAQIDCYAADRATVVKLSSLIDDVLNGFSGVLADADSTSVDHIFREEEPVDHFDDAPRTYRRMTEYEIWYFARSA